MSDYQSLMQPVAQALLTIDAAGDPVIVGQGFASVERVGTGDFLLNMDAGTGVLDVASGNPMIVNGQAVPGGFPNGRVGPNGLDPTFARVSLTMRGGNGVAPGLAPGSTLISNLSASFVTAPDTGALQISIQTATIPALGGLTDPSGAGVASPAGSGLEVVVWKLAVPDVGSAPALVGPLFQGAMQFP